MTFGIARLRELREAKDLNRAELARLAGINWKTIHRLEEGTGTVRSETLKKLADALEVRPAELMRERG
jgi:transcriptional regulator with XRE-family HTH domain